MIIFSHIACFFLCKTCTICTPDYSPCSILQLTKWRRWDRKIHPRDQFSIHELVRNMTILLRQRRSQQGHDEEDYVQLLMKRISFPSQPQKLVVYFLKDFQRVFLVIFLYIKDCKSWRRTFWCHSPKRKFVSEADMSQPNWGTIISQCWNPASYSPSTTRNMCMRHGKYKKEVLTAQKQVTDQARLRRQIPEDRKSLGNQHCKERERVKTKNVLLFSEWMLVFQQQYHII